MWLLLTMVLAGSTATPTPDQGPAGAAPASAVSLRPYKPTPLATLRTASRAAAGPRTAALETAWRHYERLHGSWRPKAQKPSAEDVAAFDAFKAGLELQPLPAWFHDLKPGEGLAALVFDPADPRFAAQRETEETERVKALGIVYLTEHELDRPKSAERGATLLATLALRTPFDPQLHAFLARFLADAGKPREAVAEARLAIYLDPAPGPAQLAFTAFVGYLAVRDGWPMFQVLLREAAARPEDAEAVIKAWDPIYRGDAKPIIVPLER
jgi:hypothetical protein